MSIFGGGLNELELVISGIGDEWFIPIEVEEAFRVQGLFIRQINLSPKVIKQISISNTEDIYQINFEVFQISQINVKKTPELHQINLEPQDLKQINVEKALNIDVHQINLKVTGIILPYYYQGQTVTRRYEVRDKSGTLMSLDDIKAKIIDAKGITKEEAKSFVSGETGYYEINYNLDNSGETGAWIIFITATKGTYIEKFLDTFEVVKTK